jgi:hypothetical protein
MNAQRSRITYRVYEYKTRWNDIPEHLTDSPSRLADLMPYLKDLGAKDLNLSGDRKELLRDLGVVNLESQSMIDEIGGGEWSISLFKEPAFIVKMI